MTAIQNFLRERRGFLLLLPLLLLLAACRACPTSVEVPTAHVAKFVTSSGLQEGLEQTGKYRIAGWCLSCESMVLVETADVPIVKDMMIFMPKDKLNLGVELRGTFTVDPAKANVERVFGKVSAGKIPEGMNIEGGGSGLLSRVSTQKVYDTYGPQVVEEASRSVITKYTIAEVMTNRESISQEIQAAVNRGLKGTPLKALRFGLANIQPPSIIVKAQEEATQREIALQKAEAQKKIDIKKAEARLEVAQKQQAADLVEAETQVLVNIKLAESVSDAFVTQRVLKFLQTVAENDNKTLVLPLEAFRYVGAQMRAINFDTEIGNSPSTSTRTAPSTAQEDKEGYDQDQPETDDPDG